MPAVAGEGWLLELLACLGADLEDLEPEPAGEGDDPAEGGEGAPLCLGGPCRRRGQRAMVRPMRKGGGS